MSWWGKSGVEPLVIGPVHAHAQWKTAGRPLFCFWPRTDKLHRQLTTTPSVSLFLLLLQRSAAMRRGAMQQR